MEVWRLRAWLVSLLATTFFHTLDSAGDGFDSAQKPHVRQKRLLWITSDGRLALPPGTHLTITPSLSLPFVRYPPDGFLSNMSISLPFSSKYVGIMYLTQYLSYVRILISHLMNFQLILIYWV